MVGHHGHSGGYHHYRSRNCWRLPAAHLRLLASGETNRTIALKLGISVKTVETHRANVMRKLGLQSLVELVHYAVRNLMVEPLPSPGASAAPSDPAAEGATPLRAEQEA